MFEKSYVYFITLIRRGKNRISPFWELIVSLIFCNYLPLEKGVALHLHKLKYPSPKDACAKFGCVSGEDFLKFVNAFSLFIIISPLEKGVGLSSFEQTWKIFLLFHINHLPLEKGVALHLNKFEYPSPKNALCQVWLKMTQLFLRRGWKCDQFTDGTTGVQKYIPVSS